MTDRHAGIGNADLGLCRFLGEVGDLLRLRADFHSRLLAPFPVTEETLDLLEQGLPFDIPRHGEDGAARAKEPLIVLLDRLDGEFLDPFLGPVTILSEW